MSAGRAGSGGVWLALVALALTISACAVRPYNAALAETGPAKPYTFTSRLPRNSPKLFVVLTFSGGGTRAAAFTLGVLETLAATTIVVDGRPRRLLDEVDVITAVSGGSFTAAYYGLFGERVFTDFPERFLYRDVQGEMLAALLSPLQLGRIVAPQFSRTDVAAEYLDRTLFDGRTFTDLSADGRRPYVARPGSRRRSPNATLRTASSTRRPRSRATSIPSRFRGCGSSTAASSTISGCAAAS